LTSRTGGTTTWIRALLVHGEIPIRVIPSLPAGRQGRQARDENRKRES